MTTQHTSMRRVHDNLVDQVVTNWGTPLSSSQEEKLREQLMTIDLPEQDARKLEELACKK